LVVVVTILCKYKNQCDEQVKGPAITMRFEGFISWKTENKKKDKRDEH